MIGIALTFDISLLPFGKPNSPWPCKPGGLLTGGGGGGGGGGTWGRGIRAFSSSEMPRNASIKLAGGDGIGGIGGICGIGIDPSENGCACTESALSACDLIEFEVDVEVEDVIDIGLGDLLLGIDVGSGTGVGANIHGRICCVDALIASLTQLSIASESFGSNPLSRAHDGAPQYLHFDAFLLFFEWHPVHLHTSSSVACFSSCCAYVSLSPLLVFEL